MGKERVLTLASLADYAVLRLYSWDLPTKFGGCISLPSVPYCASGSNNLLYTNGRIWPSFTLTGVNDFSVHDRMQATRLVGLGSCLGLPRDYLCAFCRNRNRNLWLPKYNHNG